MVSFGFPVSRDSPPGQTKSVVYRILHQAIKANQILHQTIKANQIRRVPADVHFTNVHVSQHMCLARSNRTHF